MVSASESVLQFSDQLDKLWKSWNQRKRGGKKGQANADGL